jgi:hypothetical protein
MKKDQITSAVDRLFRAYITYCEKPTEDSLFLLLNALHSLDDKLKDKHGRVLFDIEEYIALKALRNYLHHQGEVENILRMKPIGDLPATADLEMVCLVSTADCVAALAATDKKYKDATEAAMTSVFKFWNSVADINPCVFNCIVRVYEKLLLLGHPGRSVEYHRFKEQYEWESRNRQSHYATGAVGLLPGHIDEYANRMVQL